jgi:protein-S-isoprenylcysteine O-methyltransferase Ste14
MANGVIGAAADGPTSLRARFARFEGTRLYDMLAATPLVLWSLVYAEQQVPALLRMIASTDPATWDTLFFARLMAKVASILFLGLLLVLLPIRRVPQRKTHGLHPRIAALAGTYLGVAMMFLPERGDGSGMLVASAALVFTGTLFSAWSLSRLGRSISLLPEARLLVTDGPYALIRHPLYLGEAVTLIGLSLQYLSLPAMLIIALQITFQLQRMKHEEGVLSAAFPDYGPYMARTARLIPGLY